MILKDLRALLQSLAIDLIRFLGAGRLALPFTHKEWLDKLIHPRAARTPDT